jgi:hypothetical protein
MAFSSSGLLIHVVVRSTSTFASSTLADSTWSSATRGSVQGQRGRTPTLRCCLAGGRTPKSVTLATGSR